MKQTDLLERSVALNARNGHMQVAPTLEDLDWLQDNGPCLRLQSLQLPGATVEPRGEAFLLAVLQCSAASLTRLDFGHMAASSLDFLEGLSQQNTLHTLNTSGQRGCQLHLHACNDSILPQLAGLAQGPHLAKPHFWLPQSMTDAHHVKASSSASHLMAPCLLQAARSCLTCTCSGT